MSAPKTELGRRGVLAAGIVGGLALSMEAVPAQSGHTDQSSGMARFVVFYDRPANEIEFQRHYREVHIPLVRKLAGLRRYRLSRNMRAIRGGESYYMIAELEWDDMDALQRAFRSPEGQAAGKDVDENLLRLNPGIRSMVYEVEEIVAPQA